MSKALGGAMMQYASGANVDYESSPLDPGEPLNVSVYEYGGKWGIQWTNNPTARPTSTYTQYSLDGGSTIKGEKAPGETDASGFPLPITAGAVRHRQADRYSDWVLADGGLGF